MTVSKGLRKRLDTQGFLDVETKSTARWLKFSPLMCAIGFALGTYLQSPALLFVMALFAVAGLSFHHTPFDWLYLYAVKPVINGPELPKRPAPARFACFVAVVWSSVTASAFLIEYKMIATVLGIALTGAATLMGTVNYCIASSFWRMIYGWPDQE
ncbi:MAG: hypothetical protein BRC30_03485 [Nanohaloarchaea archaeon SW_7_46_7]|nr:MAG: hypothetical protein BRC30_03485 [Nanohaloarchaea archaeon SW_7_46_7]